MPGSNGRLETDSHADTCRAGNNCVVLEFDDDMGQSVLVQQEQNAIWREEQQLFNTTEDNLTVSRTTTNNERQQPPGRTTAATPTQGQ